MDKTFDNKETYLYFIKDVACRVFETTKFEPTRGVKNIMYDMKVLGGPYKGITVEVKTRKEAYTDFAVEFTQFGTGPDGKRAKKYNPKTHKDEGREYRRLLDDLDDGDITKEELIEKLSENTAWIWKSKAEFILYITPKSADLINKNLLYEFIVEHFLELPERFSSKSTGAYNKIIDKSQFKGYKDVTDIVDIDRYIRSWQDE